MGQEIVSIDPADAHENSEGVEEEIGEEAVELNQDACGDREPDG